MIRISKSTELSSVMQIWLEGNIEANPFIPTEFWQRETEFMRQLMRQSEIYVYEDENSHKVIGFIGIKDNFIGGLFVHPNFRTTGIGKKLVDFVKLHNTYLLLHVYAKNRYGLKFYQQEGFSILKEGTDPETSEKMLVMGWEK